MCPLGVFLMTTAPTTPTSLLQKVSPAKYNERDKKQQLWRLFGPRALCGDTKGTSLLRKLMYLMFLLLLCRVSSLVDIVQIKSKNSFIKDSIYSLVVVLHASTI